MVEFVFGPIPKIQTPSHDLKNVIDPRSASPLPRYGTSKLEKKTFLPKTHVPSLRVTPAPGPPKCRRTRGHTVHCPDTNKYGCKLEKRIQVAFSFCPIPCPFALTKWGGGGGAIIVPHCSPLFMCCGYQRNLEFFSI